MGTLHTWKAVMLVALFALPVAATPGAVSAVSAFASPARGALVFADEFDGTNLDTTTWATTCDGGSPEATSPCGGTDQYFDPTALSVSDGALHITATPTPIYGHPYTSGIIRTSGTFAQVYGYWEMRARMPQGVGMWPAFWGIPESGGPPELDVMEMYMGDSSSQVKYNVHWKGCGGECDHGSASDPAGDLTQGYHTFAMDWRADHVTWYVDGAAQWTQTSKQARIPSRSFALIIQLAVGSGWNSQHGAGETATMDVDYVRIYQ